MAGVEIVLGLQALAVSSDLGAGYMAPACGHTCSVSCGVTVVTLT